MTRLLFVRHGTTAWNADGTLQGWADVALAPEGRREAGEIGAAIADAHDVGRVVTSPLRRARETADIVAEWTGTESVVADPGWRERSFGVYEGESAEQAFSANPEIHPRSSSFSADVAPLGGESVSTVVARVRQRWHTLVRGSGGDGTVGEESDGEGGVDIVVTHETPLRVVAGLVDGDDPVAAVRSHSFDAGTVLAVEGVGPGIDARWRVFPTDRE